MQFSVLNYIHFGIIAKCFCSLVDGITVAFSALAGNHPTIIKVCTFVVFAMAKTIFCFFPGMEKW